MNPGELSELTLEALAKALEHDYPVPLKSAAKKPGLLPTGRVTPARTLAIKECLDATRNLFVNTGSEKEPIVRITKDGIEALFLHRSLVQRNELLAKTASTLKEMATTVARHLAQRDLEEIVKQQERLTKQSVELRNEFTRVLRDQLTRVERVIAELSTQAVDLRNLLESPEPEQKVEPKQKNGLSRRKGESPEGPKTDEDIDFQRDLCRELALAWQDAREPTAREALERVMFNTQGLERIGEPGEVVTFDGIRHEVMPGASVQPKQPVEVIEPGWIFRSPRGEYLLVNAQVKPLP